MAKRKLLTKKQRRAWNLYINGLRKRLPTEKPLIVKTRKLPKNFDAFAGEVDGCWLIQISSELSYLARVDALIHEYAHALDDVHRHGGDHDKEHGKDWGILYGEVYRALASISDEIRKKTDEAASE